MHDTNRSHELPKIESNKKTPPSNFQQDDNQDITAGVLTAPDWISPHSSPTRQVCHCVPLCARERSAEH